ncbi:hypothetical protein [Streptomyces pseudovenezuelae]|uniref:hypothetical protein n=1 Tax=Streptomyces pseudovenezuelae TaxID=67350 RepID=UPI0036EBD921
MTVLVLAALLVLWGIAHIALRGATGPQVSAVTTKLTRAVVVLVLAYVALRLAEPEDIKNVLQTALGYLRI